MRRILLLSALILLIISCNSNRSPDGVASHAVRDTTTSHLKAATNADSLCAKTQLTIIGKYKVWKFTASSIIAFTAKMDIDADGSPRAYGPAGKGLDNLTNAGKPGHWVGILADKNGAPVVQKTGDPYPGFYVSTTTMEDRSFAKENPKRYVNAEEIPFVVLPGGVSEPGNIKVGDLAFVYNTLNDKSSFAIFADCGPEGKLGEASMYLAKQLGVADNPKSGGTDKPVIRYLIFPGSGKGEHTKRTREEIIQDGQSAFDKAGGKAIMDCLAN